MTALFQGSLLGVGNQPRPGRLDGEVTRIPLPDGAWVDLRAGWIEAADTLFDVLWHSVPWQAEQRPMYDRIVDVPRLLSFYGPGAPLPHPALEAAKASLDAYYAAELGEPFATAGLCLYRDGRDSVAWHGDIIGRGKTTDTMVAIISLGTPRTLLLRRRGIPASRPGGQANRRGIPADRPGGQADRPDITADRPGIPANPPGGQALRFRVGHGDLLVMGGSCQRTWEHAIPKTAKAIGPRISVQFRPRDVR